MTPLYVIERRYSGYGTDDIARFTMTAVDNRTFVDEDDPYKTQRTQLLCFDGDGFLKWIDMSFVKVIGRP